MNLVIVTETIAHIIIIINVGTKFGIRHTVFSKVSLEIFFKMIIRPPIVRMRLNTNYFNVIHLDYTVFKSL